MVGAGAGTLGATSAGLTGLDQLELSAGLGVVDPESWQSGRGFACLRDRRAESMVRRSTLKGLGKAWCLLQSLCVCHLVHTALRLVVQYSRSP